jgi:hypothetical protein
VTLKKFTGDWLRKTRREKSVSPSGLPSGHPQNVLCLLSQVLDLDDYNLRIAAIQLRN